METPPPHVQRGVFANLSLFQFLSFVRRGIFYTFMIEYLYGLMQTVTYTTLLGSFNMVASALGQNLLWGKISDRYNIRTKLIVAGESIAAGTYFIVYQIHRSLLNVGSEFTAGLSLIIGLSFLEFFWSMSDVGWSALLTDMTTTETRGRTVGFLNFIASVGRMIGIFFSGFLYMGGAGFRDGTLFYIVIAMLLTSTTIMLIATRTIKPAGKSKKVNSTRAETNLDGPHAIHGERLYRWFLASLIIIVIGASCINQVFLLFLKLPQSIGGLAASDEEMAYILTAWTIGGIATSLACGWLADRIGRIKVLIAGLLLAIATPLLYGLASTPLALAIVYGLNGISFWTIQIVGFAFAGDIIHHGKRGRLLGKYNAVMALSWGPAGLIVGGPLADLQTRNGLSAYAAYINTFYASAIIVAVGTLIFGLKVAKSVGKPLKS